jgi:hypothetical protein
MLSVSSIPIFSPVVLAGPPLKGFLVDELNKLHLLSPFTLPFFGRLFLE